MDSLVSFAGRVECGDQVNIFRHCIKPGLKKPEGVAVAFFDEDILNGVRFAEAALPVFFIVAVLAVAERFAEDLLDVIRRLLDVGALFVDVVEEQAQDDVLLAQVDARVDGLALDALTAVDEHVPAPSVAIADDITMGVAQAGYFVIEGLREGLVRCRDVIKTGFV